MATDADISFTVLMSGVQGVEPYESVFKNTLPDMRYGTTATVRWRARREWMAFMRIHVTDYLSLWPHLRDDLVAMCEAILEHGMGRPSYLEDVTAVLAIAREM
jgi:hypothetical protein